MSLRHRISSRLRFEQYRSGRRAGGDSTPPPGEAPVRQRSLWRLYRELYAILEGHRGSIALALATLSVATLLRLVPPAATKLVIDYVLLRRPLPEAVTRRLPIPDDPEARLCCWWRRCWPSRRSGWSSGSGAAGGRRGRPSGCRSPSAGGSSSTRSGCRCTASTSSSRAGRRACSARTPAASAS